MHNIKSKYSHLSEKEKQRRIKCKKNEKAMEKRERLCASFEDLAAALKFNVAHPIPERPELLQLAIEKIDHLTREVQRKEAGQKGK